MIRPIALRSKRELYWAKQWVRNQVVAGRLENGLARTVDAVDDIEAFNRLITPHLIPDARQRLQKTLSARRARASAAEQSKRMGPSMKRVNMEVTEAVKHKAHALAAAKGVTTSELIDSYIGDDYERLPSYQR